uniref:AMP-dependent synthetase/ligase domain-containing protein n=1 Tax=Hordeum vulgare subsp. vulgare TaxID=112509 RepID=A0A8I7BHV2_HORVV
MEAEALERGGAGGDAAAFVLSRLPHPDDAAAGARAAYVDAATGRALSFAGLRGAALSLASALRLGLGLRRGDAVLVALPSPDDDPLLLPPILLGVLAAGCVAVVAAPAAAANMSGVKIVVGAVAVGTLPLLLASRSPDPRALSAEELMDGGDPAALDAVDADGRPGPSEVALVVYPSTGERELMRHTDLVTAVAGAALPDEGRVCLASLPGWGADVHGGVALLALGLPAGGATTVLLPPSSSDLRAAVAAHGATDVVATTEAAAALFAPALPQGKLASLRRVTVVTPLEDDARQAFRRRLSWVDLAEMGAATAESPEQVQVAPAPLLFVQPDAAATQLKGKIPDQMPETSDATSLVSPLQKIRKTVLSDVFANSVAGKFLRSNPVVCDKQAVSKL